jgi:magnesium-transporting ATPase (P-type)
VAVKGATERILPFCETMRTGEGDLPLEADAMEEAALELATEGFRVLAIAEGPVDGEPTAKKYGEEDIPPLTLLGLVGFIDPLRPEVVAAVDDCRAAGVDVVMVTGDHPATALAISRELHIATSSDDVITGDELDRTSMSSTVDPNTTRLSAYL